MQMLTLVYFNLLLTTLCATVILYDRFYKANIFKIDKERELKENIEFKKKD